MPQASMHEHMRYQLMGLKENRMDVMKRESVCDPKRIPHCLGQDFLRHEHECINDDQILNNRRKPVRPHLLVITHFAKIRTVRGWLGFKGVKFKSLKVEGFKGLNHQDLLRS